MMSRTPRFVTTSSETSAGTFTIGIAGPEADVGWLLTEQQSLGAFPLARLEFAATRVIETSGMALSSSRGKGRASDGKRDAIQDVGIGPIGVSSGEALL